MSSPTSAEPALLAVAPRRQNRGTCDERDRPTCSQLRRGGLFGVQRGNVRSEGKPRTSASASRSTSHHVAATLAASRHLVRTRVIPRWRERRFGNRPIVMGRANNAHGGVLQAVALSISVAYRSVKPCEPARTRRCRCLGRPSRAPLRRSPQALGWARPTRRMSTWRRQNRLGHLSPRHVSPSQLRSAVSCSAMTVP